MFSRISLVLQGLLGVGLLAFGVGSAVAQPPPPIDRPAPASPPPPPPSPFNTIYGDYNYARALRHFQLSPYSFRTFSSMSAGYEGSVYYPYARESYYREPRYEHRRVSPYGYEHYGHVPGYGSYTETPYWESGYRVRGQDYYRYLPPAPPWR